MKDDISTSAPESAVGNAIQTALNITHNWVVQADGDDLAPIVLGQLDAAGYVVLPRELVTEHEDMIDCGCGTFDDWFDRWTKP